MDRSRAQKGVREGGWRRIEEWRRGKQAGFDLGQAGFQLLGRKGGQVSCVQDVDGGMGWGWISRFVLEGLRHGMFDDMLGHADPGVEGHGLHGSGRKARCGVDNGHGP